MFNIFKKKEEGIMDIERKLQSSAQASAETSSPFSNESSSGSSNNKPSTNSPVSSELSPPANLPELAKDMFGRESMVENARIRLSRDDEEPALEKHRTHIPSEPKAGSVPRFDMSLIRQGRESVSEEIPHAQNAIPKIPLQPTPPPKPVPQPPTHPQYNLYDANLFKSNSMNTYADADITNIYRTQNNRFFADLEQYIMSGHARMLDKLKGSNMLDLMKDYSGVDTGLMKELELLEELWHYSHKKYLATKTMMEDVETDILYKSEQLKKILPRKHVVPFGNALKAREHTASNIPTNNRQDQPDQKVRSDAMNPPRVPDVEDLELSDPAKFFYLSNGKALKSLKELYEELDMMDYTIYYSHANPYKNDFASWIEGVFELKDLASEMRKASSSRELRQIMAEFFNWG